MPSESYPEAAPPQALSLISNLFSQLEAANVDYCHWKSNATLDEALLGAGDLDLLVGSHSATEFQAILFQLGFKLVRQPRWAEHSSIYHYFGLDTESGKIVHVHVYYRLVTGGVLQKNLHMPLEAAMLGDKARNLGVRVPTLAAELAGMVLRKMFEASSPLELTLLKLDWNHVRSEVDWILSEDEATNQVTIDESLRIVCEAIPGMEHEVYLQAVAALRADTSWTQLYRLGRRMCKYLNAYSLRSRTAAVVGSSARAVVRVINKLRPGKRPAKGLFTAGRVVAIVGPEASGKSTLTTDLKNWLGRSIDVALIHTGKPKASVLTWIPNRLVRLLRTFKKNEQFKRHENAGATTSNTKNVLPSHPLMLRLYAIRSWWLAYDRYRSVRRAHRLASRGSVVICDRYPTARVGAMDSPRLLASHPAIQRSKLLSALSRAEQNCYRCMPLADTIVRLDVPVELAVSRNQERIKADKEGEAFVRLRHAKWEQQEFDCRDLVTVDTSQDQLAVISQVRQLVWDRL